MAVSGADWPILLPAQVVNFFFHVFMYRINVKISSNLAVVTFGGALLSGSINDRVSAQ